MGLNGETIGYKGDTMGHSTNLTGRRRLSGDSISRKSPWCLIIFNIEIASCGGLLKSRRGGWRKRERERNTARIKKIKKVYRFIMFFQLVFQFKMVISQSPMLLSLRLTKKNNMMNTWIEQVKLWTFCKYNFEQRRNTENIRKWDWNN